MLRKVLIPTAGGLLVALALFLLLELGVRASGRMELTPGAVLDRDAQYFLPHAEQKGIWTTTYWQEVRDELELNVLGQRRKRVLLFGGSNAWSFGTQPLKNELVDGVPGQRFQVLNLGRNGYGSERVRLVFEQALEHLDPDFVVLYFGDNEFVESPWPGPVRSLPVGLRRLHSARMISTLIHRSSRRHPVPPETWMPDWDYYMGLTLDQTQERLDLLRRNVSGMIETAEARGVRVVLCTVVFNRFSAPYGGRIDLEGEPRKRFGQLREEATACLPAFLAPLLPVHKDDRVRRMDWDLGTPDEPGARADGQRVGMRECSGRFADIELWLSPPEKWHARLWRLNETLRQLHARELDAAQREALGRAAELLDEALAIAPDHPRTLFERALVAYLMQEDAERVERLFLDAASYDRAPKKSSQAINDLLREVAAEHPETLLVDIDERFAEWSPDRLVGWEVMYDHCHILPGAAAVVMHLIGEAMLERWFPSD